MLTEFPEEGIVRGTSKGNRGSNVGCVQMCLFHLQHKVNYTHTTRRDMNSNKYNVIKRYLLPHGEL